MYECGTMETKLLYTYKVRVLHCSVHIHVYGTLKTLRQIYKSTRGVKERGVTQPPVTQHGRLDHMYMYNDHMHTLIGAGE